MSWFLLMNQNHNLQLHYVAKKDSSVLADHINQVRISWLSADAIGIRRLSQHPYIKGPFSIISSFIGFLRSSLPSSTPRSTSHPFRTCPSDIPLRIKTYFFLNCCWTLMMNHTANPKYILLVNHLCQYNSGPDRTES